VFDIYSTAWSAAHALRSCEPDKHARIVYGLKVYQHLAVRALVQTFLGLDRRAFIALCPWS
jgi:hypothetical protein